jgi:4,5-DOPA dioxygenase extradiol
MQHLGEVITRLWGQPRAVLAVSAHSLTREPVLLAAPRHEAVYDFGGFDPRLYQMRYDAPGAPDLAQRVQGLLQAAGLPVHRVEQGGLDHGIWTPLRFMFPDADVPVLPLAWPPNWSPEQLFALGQALAPLADEGVLIVGSGSITHNLRRVFAGGGLHPPERAATPESTSFRNWFADHAAAADWPGLFSYRSRAPHAELMHPTDEHLLPFYVAAGAGAADEKGAGLRIHESLVFGELGMDAYAFGPGARGLQQALN